jgi:LmbE family N-acetylglucosaminyl deacetylase
MKSRIQESGMRKQKRLVAVWPKTPVWAAIIIFVLAAAIAPVSGQRAGASAGNLQHNDPELYQALLDLQNPWTVMCVAAHPDDEDGATLTILRRKYGAHTLTLFTTYGEGGQNATGPELYEELGAIRARETLAASAIQGSEAHFLGLPDFGFSKSAEEAFRIWGHQEALRRMVLKIRQLRPDVIITNHNTSSGHGHHQATGRLVLEAFDAAANPESFPEQLRDGLRVWQAQRLFVRVGAPGATEPQATGDEAQRAATIVSINRGERDAVRDSTYAEQALRALQQHASQGPWPQTLPASWASTIRYRLVRSAKMAAPLPMNAQTPLDGLRLSQTTADELTPLAAQALLPLYSARAARESILGALVAARKAGMFAAATRAGEERRFQLMTDRLNRALAIASGIKATFMPENDVLIPGTTTKISLVIKNEGETPAHVQSITLRGLQPSSKLNFPQTVAPGQYLSLELQTFTPQTTPISVPPAEHLYDGNFFGQELAASAQIEIEGATFPVAATTHLNVAPAIEIESVDPAHLVVTPATINRPAAFTLRVSNHLKRDFTGGVIVEGPTRRAKPLRRALTLADGGALEVKVTHSLQLNEADFGRGNAQHLLHTVSFTIAGRNLPGPVSKRTVSIVWSDARVAAGLRVGYLKSFDETLRNSLAALGVEAKELTVNDVRLNDLSGYQAIIIDNRGYQAHPELITANSRLLDYVKAGGTLIVFYHRTNEWNPDPQRNRPQLAPYPIIIGNSRVTDENAPIEFTEPQHPLLNYPNKIGPEDFKGWIQERGLYYPQSWDKQYSALLATNDQGEQPLRGGLLAADYGRGRYIYTSMVWYRQLRAGQPGAYRVLANMISYGRKGN